VYGTVQGCPGGVCGGPHVDKYHREALKREEGGGRGLGRGEGPDALEQRRTELGEQRHGAGLKHASA
jgi:hypothetical protein